MQNVHIGPAVHDQEPSRSDFDLLFWCGRTLVAASNASNDRNSENSTGKILFVFIEINVANAHVDACVGRTKKVFESPLIGTIIFIKNTFGSYCNPTVRIL
jgi:hypothetical protein